MSNKNNIGNHRSIHSPGGLPDTLYAPSQDSETSPLLSTRRIHTTNSNVWPAIKSAAGKSWSWIAGVLNPPLIAALVAVFFGLIPPLRHGFFDKGTPLNATITQSINYLGQLYTGESCISN